MRPSCFTRISVIKILPILLLSFLPGCVEDSFPAYIQLTARMFRGPIGDLKATARWSRYRGNNFGNYELRKYASADYSMTAGTVVKVITDVSDTSFTSDYNGE